MKAFLQDGTLVELGHENMVSVARAGRLYRKGVFAKVILEDPVPTAGYSTDAPIGGFWTLVRAGFVHRTLTPNTLAEGSDVTYSVVADIEFTDAHGYNWKKGYEQTWEK